MSVKMRLTRLGDNKTPFYRIVVVDSRTARDGAYLDQIGTYDPLKTPVELKLDKEKAAKWVANGVQPTDTVKALLVKEGIMTASTPKKPSKKTLNAQKVAEEQKAKKADEKGNK